MPLSPLDADAFAAADAFATPPMLPFQLIDIFAMPCCRRLSLMFADAMAAAITPAPLLPLIRHDTLRF